MNENAINLLFYLTTSISLSAAAIGALLTIYRMIIALRAKHRAHLILLREALYDEEVRSLYEAAKLNDLTDREAQIAMDKVASIIIKLPREDRKFLEGGLHQRNTADSKRFAKNVLLAA
jgi:hypothetical protein